MATATSPTPRRPPTADARLDNHAGPNRGILIAPYTRSAAQATGELVPGPGLRAVLRLPRRGAAWWTTAATSASDTNFNWHGYHMNDHHRRRNVAARDIDVPGAGPGNAICAECHFRTHGTALAINGQAQAPRPRELRSQRPSPQRGPGLHARRGLDHLGTCTLNLPRQAPHELRVRLPGITVGPAPVAPLPAARTTAPCIERYRACAHLPPLALPGPGGNVRPDGWAPGCVSPDNPLRCQAATPAATNEGSNMVRTPARGRRCARPRGGLG